MRKVLLYTMAELLEKYPDAKFDLEGNMYCGSLTLIPEMYRALGNTIKVDSDLKCYKDIDWSGIIKEEVEEKKQKILYRYCLETDDDIWEPESYLDEDGNTKGGESPFTKSAWDSFIKTKINAPIRV